MGQKARPPVGDGQPDGLRVNARRPTEEPPHWSGRWKNWILAPIRAVISWGSRLLHGGKRVKGWIFGLVPAAINWGSRLLNAGGRLKNWIIAKSWIVKAVFAVLIVFGTLVFVRYNAGDHRKCRENSVSISAGRGEPSTAARISIDPTDPDDPDVPEYVNERSANARQGWTFSDFRLDTDHEDGKKVPKRAKIEVEEKDLQAPIELHVWMREDGFRFERIVLNHIKNAPEIDRFAHTSSYRDSAPGGVFREKSGVVVLRAIDGTREGDPKYQHQWTKKTDKDGTSYLEATPTLGCIQRGHYEGEVPEVRYLVKFSQPGEYRLYVRGYRDADSGKLLARVLLGVSFLYVILGTILDYLFTGMTQGKRSATIGVSVNLVLAGGVVFVLVQGYLNPGSDWLFKEPWGLPMKNVATVIIALLFVWIDRSIKKTAVRDDWLIAGSLILSTLLVFCVGKELLTPKFFLGFNTGILAFHVFLGTLLFSSGKEVT